MTGEDAYIETEREHFAQVAPGQADRALAALDEVERRIEDAPISDRAEYAVLHIVREVRANYAAEATTRAPSIGTEPYRGKG